MLLMVLSSDTTCILWKAQDNLPGDFHASLATALDAWYIHDDLSEEDLSPFASLSTTFGG